MRTVGFRLQIDCYEATGPRRIVFLRMGRWLLRRGCQQEHGYVLWCNHHARDRDGLAFRLPTPFGG